MMNSKTPENVAAVEPMVIVRNCENCELFGSDDDGNYPECAISGPVCNKTYLKDDEEDNTDKPGFPFTTDQPCHVPGFWQYAALDSERSVMFDKETADESSYKDGVPSFDKTYARFKEKFGL